MSSSWKKVKSGRLSQVLSDRISERRRRGAESPLVVETGFPTSIIDLFVKNKDKLKNPLFKKREKNDPRMCDMSGDDCDYGVSDVSSPPPPPPPPPPSLMASPMNQISGDGGGDDGGSGVVVENGSGGERECVHRNLVLAVVLRLFFVVVLALGTKKFVVGITFSAFVLLFLEYLVKHRLIRIVCIKMKEMISLNVGKVMGLLRLRKGSPEESKAVIEILEEKGRMMCDSRRGVEETEIVGTEIQCETEKQGDCDEKVENVYIKDIVRAEAGEGLRSRKSRGEKMRVKMRKFLPKRLRKNKPQCVDVGVGNVGLNEEEKDERQLSSGEASCLSSMSRDVDELVELSISQNEEETTQPIEHSSSSYISLVLIVLVGLLVGGRVLALVLTVSWCLLLKSGRAILRRCIKASIFRSPAKKLHNVVQ